MKARQQLLVTSHIRHETTHNVTQRSGLETVIAGHRFKRRQVQLCQMSCSSRTRNSQHGETPIEGFWVGSRHGLKRRTDGISSIFKMCSSSYDDFDQHEFDRVIKYLQTPACVHEIVTRNRPWRFFRL